MNYFHFDEEDLAANRLGKLSEKQRRKYQGELGKYIQTGTRISMVSFGVGLLFILVSVLLFQLLGGLILGTGFVALICFVLGFFTYRRASIRRSFLANLSKDIARVQGPINIEHGESREDCFLYIGKEEFDITERIASHLEQGKVYAIYFEVESQSILSLELVQ